MSVHSDCFENAFKTSIVTKNLGIWESGNVPITEAALLNINNQLFCFYKTPPDLSSTPRYIEFCAVALKSLDYRVAVEPSRGHFNFVLVQLRDERLPDFPYRI